MHRKGASIGGVRRSLIVFQQVSGGFILRFTQFQLAAREVLRILQLRQARLRLEGLVQSLAVAVAPLCGGIRVPERGC